MDLDYVNNFCLLIKSHFQFFFHNNFLSRIILIWSWKKMILSWEKDDAIEFLFCNLFSFGLNVSSNLELSSYVDFLFSILVLESSAHTFLISMYLFVFFICVRTHINIYIILECESVRSGTPIKLDDVSGYGTADSCSDKTPPYLPTNRL